MGLFEIFEKRVVLVSLAIFILIYFVFFPPFFASIDEHEYIRNSYLLQKGTLVEKDASIACTGKFNGEGYVSQYFIGRSLFLIPFTWFGLFGIMLSGLILHLINFFIFSKILERIGSDRKYSLFYLLYPAFFWSSRTVNSEVFVLMGLLAGVYFYLSDKKKWNMLSGLFFGISILGRYDSILLVLPFFLVPLVKDRGKFVYMLAGFLPVFIAMIFFNSIFYGGALSTGYGNPLNFISRIFSNQLLVKNILTYLAILFLAYPLLVLGPLKAGKMKFEIIIGAALYIIFYSSLSDPSVYTFLSPVTFTGRLRYLIPALGLLILFYGDLYEGIIKKIKLPEKKTFVIVITFLLCIYIAASFVHGKFLDERTFVLNSVYKNTNLNSSLVGSGEVCTFVLPQVFGNRSYSTIYNKTIESLGENSYLVDVFYSTVDVSTYRGGLVSDSRKQITEFIVNNSKHLQLIYNSTNPHTLQIYTITRP